MTTHSIILHDYEVRAALAGTLGLVVRPVSLRHVHDIEEDGTPMRECKDGIWREATCPLGVPGDRLCCRESYYIQDAHGKHREDGLRWGSWSGLPTTISPDGKRIVYYKEGFDRCAPCWRYPATMPAWASRITLEVVGVRCCRLGDLTADDARMAGFNGDDVTALGALCLNWQERYQAKHFGIETRPWAWAVGVRRVEG